jgi:hypothetical protein
MRLRITGDGEAIHLLGAQLLAIKSLWRRSKLDVFFTSALYHLLRAEQRMASP